MCIFSPQNTITSLALYEYYRTQALVGTLVFPKGSLNPSGQSEKNLTIVDQVIVLGASVRTHRYSSGVSKAYFVNPYSFTPLPL